MDRFSSFERAFDCHVGSCRRQCECGRTFYNPDGGWDWGEGELDELDKDPQATALDYTVTVIWFEGTMYVVDCDCWRERADKIMHFIDSHAIQIAQYLNFEKERKIKEAEQVPDVSIEGGPND